MASALARKPRGNNKANAKSGKGMRCKEWNPKDSFTPQKLNEHQSM